MINNIANFYYTILGIEITTSGIIVAAFLVFIQILHSNFSYKDMLFSLRQISLKIYFIWSIFIILITSMGSLHFAMGAHDLIPYYNLRLSNFFESDYILSAILLVFLMSVLYGFIVFFKTIKLLNPSFLMREYLNRANNETIGKFLYNKYGVPEPFLPINIMFSSVKQEEEKEEIKRKEDEFNRKKKEYELIKAAAENAPDILEGFDNLLVKAISQGDRSIIKKAISDFTLKMVTVLEKADQFFPVNHLAVYIGDSLNVFLEACRKYDTMSFAPQFIKMTCEIAISFVNSTDPQEVREILKTWKEQANIAIKSPDRLMFREIIKSYQEIADIVFEKEKHSLQGRSDVLDDVFRHLGWLSECYLTEKGIEERPIMHDDSYDNEFNALYNALFHFEWKYKKDKPDAYPLIFFDAIYVLFRQLLRIYTSLEEDTRAIDRSHIKDWLFSCAYIYSSFATEAINVSNGNGVALAGMRLRELCGIAVRDSAEDVARDMIELMVGLVIRTAINPEKLVGDLSFASRITEDLERVILNSPYQDTVKSAVYENYLKIGEGDYTKKFAYIKSLGVKMGTNFGLMFDASTGLDYSQDDPRRR